MLNSPDGKYFTIGFSNGVQGNSVQFWSLHYERDRPRRRSTALALAEKRCGLNLQRNQSAGFMLQLGIPFTLPKP